MPEAVRAPVAESEVHQLRREATLADPGDALDRSPPSAPPRRRRRAPRAGSRAPPRARAGASVAARPAAGGRGAARRSPAARAPNEAPRPGRGSRPTAGSPAPAAITSRQRRYAAIAWARSPASARRRMRARCPASRRRSWRSARRVTRSPPPCRPRPLRARRAGRTPRPGARARRPGPRSYSSAISGRNGRPTEHSPPLQGAAVAGAAAVSLLRVDPPGRSGARPRSRGQTLRYAPPPTASAPPTLQGAAQRRARSCPGRQARGRPRPGARHGSGRVRR